MDTLGLAIGIETGNSVAAVDALTKSMMGLSDAGAKVSDQFRGKMLPTDAFSQMTQQMNQAGDAFSQMTRVMLAGFSQVTAAVRDQTSTLKEMLAIIVQQGTAAEQAAVAQKAAQEAISQASRASLADMRAETELGKQRVLEARANAAEMLALDRQLSAQRKQIALESAIARQAQRDAAIQAARQEASSEIEAAKQIASARNAARFGGSDLRSEHALSTTGGVNSLRSSLADQQRENDAIFRSWRAQLAQMEREDKDFETKINRAHAEALQINKSIDRQYLSDYKASLNEAYALNKEFENKQAAIRSSQAKAVYSQGALYLTGPPDAVAPALSYDEKAARARQMQERITEIAAEEERIAMARWEAQKGAQQKAPAAGGAANDDQVAAINKLRQQYGLLSQEEQVEASRLRLEIDLRKLQAKGLIDAADATRLLVDYDKAAEAESGRHAGALAKVGQILGANAMQMREMMVLLHEGMTGDLSRMPGSLFVLSAERGWDATGAFKGIKDAMSEIGPISLIAGTGVAAAGVAFAAAAVRAASLSAQVREMSGLMKGFSAPGSGISPEQLQQMTISATKYGASRSDLGDVANQLIRDPAVSRGLYQPILDSSSGIAAMLGTDVPQAAQKMIDAVKGGVRGVFDLSDAFGGKLTPAMMQTMLDMERAGHGTEAVKLGMDALTGSMKDAANEMRSDLGRALHEVGQNIDKIITTISGWAVVTVPIKTMADSLGEVASLMKAVTEGDFREAMRHISINGGQTVAMIENAQKAALAKSANDAASFDNATMPGSVSENAPGQLSALTMQRQKLLDVKEALYRTSSELELYNAKVSAEVDATEKHLSGLERELFIRRELASVIERQNFGVNAETTRINAEADWQTQVNAANKRGDQKTVDRLRIEKAVGEGTANLSEDDQYSRAQAIRRLVQAQIDAEKINKSSGSSAGTDNQIEKLQAQFKAQNDLADAYAAGNIQRVREIELEQKIALAQVGDKQGREDEIAATIRAKDALEKYSAAAQETYKQRVALQDAQFKTATLGMGADDAERAQAAYDVQKRFVGQDMNNDKIREQYQEQLKIADAIAQQNLQYASQKNAIDEVTKFGEQAFDRVGAAITQAFANGSMSAVDFKNISKAIFSEVAQEAVKLALINPIKNWLTGSSSNATLGSVASAFLGTGSGGMAQFSNMPGTPAAATMGSLVLGGGAGSFGSGSGRSTVLSIGGAALNSGSSSTLGSLLSGNISGAYSGSLLQSIFGGGSVVSNFGGTSETLTSSTQLVRLANGSVITGQQALNLAASGSNALDNAQGLGTVADNGGLSNLSNMVSTGSSLYKLANGYTSGLTSLNNWGMDNLGIGGFTQTGPVMAAPSADFVGPMPAPGSTWGLGTIAQGAGGLFSIYQGIGNISSGSAGGIVGGIGQTVGGAMMAGASLDAIAGTGIAEALGLGASMGPIGMGVAAAGMLIASLFGGESSHGPSADAAVMTGQYGQAGVPAGASANTMYPNFSETVGGISETQYLANLGRIAGVSQGGTINPNKLYAMSDGTSHREGDVGAVISANQAFANNFNLMMAQYGLTLSKQWMGLLTSGDNSNPGYGSTDAMMLAMANAGVISGKGAVGSVFANAPNTKFAQAKDLQSGLTFAGGIDDTIYNLTHNSYQQNQRQLDIQHQQNLTKAAQYGVDTTYIDQAYAEQTKRNRDDAGVAAIQATDSLSARMSKFTGDLVAAAKATTEASQAAEYLNAQRQGNVDMDKLAAQQAKEYTAAVQQAALQMQQTQNNLFGTGLSLAGYGAQSALLGVNTNLANNLFSARSSGVDMGLATTILNAQASQQSVSAVLSLVDSKLSTVTSQYQQSQSFRDAAQSMADARLTPEQAYAQQIATFRTDLTAAQGGDILARNRLLSEGQAAVQAESQYTGGTGTAIYKEVTNGLNSMADQIDKQNGTTKQDMEQQINELTQIKQNTNSMLAGFTDSADTLKSTIDTVMADYTAHISTLQGSISAINSGIDAMASLVSKVSKISSVNAQSNISSATETSLSASSTHKSYGSMTDNMYLSLYSALADSNVHSDSVNWANDNPTTASLPPAQSQLSLFNYLAQIGDIPGYASGTNFAPGGWSVVGERGPEFMYVPRGSQITPNGSDPMAAVVTEIQALRAEVAMLRQITAQAGVAVRDAVTEGNANTKAMAQATARTASKPQMVRAA